MHEHAEVAELLGDLVRRGSDPSHDPEADVQDERPSDGQATQQVVETVADEHQIAERLTAVRACAVTVVVMELLLCRQEHHEAQRRPREHG